MPAIAVTISRKNANKVHFIKIAEAASYIFYLFENLLIQIYLGSFLNGRYIILLQELPVNPFDSPLTLMMSRATQDI